MIKRRPKAMKISIFGPDFCALIFSLVGHLEKLELRSDLMDIKNQSDLSEYPISGPFFDLKQVGKTKRH